MPSNSVVVVGFNRLANVHEYQVSGSNVPMTVKSVATLLGTTVGSTVDHRSELE